LPTRNIMDGHCAIAPPCCLRGHNLEKAVETVAAAEKTPRRTHPHRFRRPRLLRPLSQSLHGRMGRRLMLINPSGKVLPCHAAEIIPGLTFGNVRVQTLESIWRDSSSFQRFRGEEWMPEPCRTCDRRTEDFGGCRCQALLLTGDATVTDPVCSLALHTTSSNQRWPRPIPTPQFLNPSPPRRSCNSSGPKISGTTAPIPNNRLREKPSYQRTPSVIGRVSVVVPFADPCVSRYSK